MIFIKKTFRFGRYTFGIVFGKEEWHSNKRRKLRTKQRSAAERVQIKHELYIEQKGLCKRCEQPFSELALQKDHVIPLRTVMDDSLDTKDNLQLLCPPCHKIKTREDSKKHKWRRTPKRVVKFYI